MQIPRFPECYHPLIETTLGHDDQELLQRFCQYPGAGRYFVAIFCRYSPLVYSLIHHAAQSAVQVDYLFAQAWQQIYQELQSVSPEHFAQADQSSSDDGEPALPQDSGTRGEELNLSHGTDAPLTLQNWIIDSVAQCIHDSAIPDAEKIRYALTYASPPLWCYLNQSLERLSPIHRLVMLLHKRFGWSVEEVSAYLTSQKAAVNTATVITLLEESYDHTSESLPQDIRDIYLSPANLKQT
ncbi:MAG: sigma-70 family RNA polymerase sigma factor [Elainellaceae cyanobacterium]